MPQRIFHAAGSFLDALPFGVTGTGILAATVAPGVSHGIPPEVLLMSGAGALLAGAGRFLVQIFMTGPASADRIRAEADYRRAEARQLEADARRCFNAPVCENFTPHEEDEETDKPAHPKVRYHKKLKFVTE